MFKSSLFAALAVFAASGAALAAPLAGPEVEFYPGQIAAQSGAMAAVEAAKLKAVRGDALEFDVLALDTASEADLGASRGGIQIDDVQINNATNNANSSNNSVNNTTTGGIADTTLNEVAGFTTLMNNTGNNVVMQSITEVNVIINN